MKANDEDITTIQDIENQIASLGDHELDQEEESIQRRSLKTIANRAKQLSKCIGSPPVISNQSLTEIPREVSNSLNGDARNEQSQQNLSNNNVASESSNERFIIDVIASSLYNDGEYTISDIETMHDYAESNGLDFK